MSVLPDFAIESLQCIEPFNHKQLQPSSYDVCLGNTFRMFKYDIGHMAIDPYNQKHLDELTELAEVPDGDRVLIYPKQFALAVTKERVAVPTNLVCRLEGKSSLGRLGLAVHITAGYIDPGFAGNITLEMVNFCPHPIVLRPGMLIAQIGFHRMDAAARKPYSGRYQGDTKATHSKYGERRTNK